VVALALAKYLVEMIAPSPALSDLSPPEPPTAVQPGGFGWMVRCEIWWGRVRRAWLRTFRKKHVERWQAKQRGQCPRFGDQVIDPRDLKYIRNVCGISFDPVDDIYRRRESLGFARYGFAELVGYSAILGLLFFVASFLAVTWHWGWLALSTVCVFIWLEVLWFFRDPERMIPADSHAILSPADGTVSHVEQCDDPELGPNTWRISIFLSIFNVHVNRIPLSGRVDQVRYFRGRFLDARHPDCATQNEQLWVDFADSLGGRFRVKQISGAIARRIVCWLRPGEEVKAGDRYGMIKFGSRTDLMIPAASVANIHVKVGDKVRGGATVLGRRK
jgi:phosphatidylserine decarboxylase